MSRFTVSEVGDKNEADWRSLWRRAGGFLPHIWQWSHWVCAPGGRPVRIGVFSKGDNLVAGIQFVECRRRALRAWVNPAPAPFGGLMATGEDTASESFLRDVLSALSDYLTSRSRASLVELVLPPGMDDARPLIWKGWLARPHYDYLSRIDSMGGLSQSAENSVRRQVAKAEKEGMVFETGTGLLDELLGLWQGTRKRQGIPDNVSTEALTRMATGLCSGEEPGVSGVVAGIRLSNGGPLVAGAIIGVDQARAYYLLGASADSEEGGQAGAPSLLHFRITDHLYGILTHSYDYDWVGANTPSIAQFKKKFRPRLVACQWVVYTDKLGRMAGL